MFVHGFQITIIFIIITLGNDGGVGGGGDDDDPGITGGDESGFYRPRILNHSGFLLMEVRGVSLHIFDRF